VAYGPISTNVLSSAISRAPQLGLLLRTCSVAPLFQLPPSAMILILKVCLYFYIISHNFEVFIIEGEDRAAICDSGTASFSEGVEKTRCL
jgi:hypothetical protein